MPLVPHRTKYIGWAYEDTQGTDKIALGGAVPYYQLGKLTSTIGNFPTKDTKTISINAGSRDPTTNITHVEPRAALGFAPVSGVEWYKFLGARADGGGGIHTITGIDTGQIPYYTTRFQSENATENIRDSLVGGKTNNVNFQILNANTRARIPALMGVGIQGMDVKAATNTASQTPVYPSSEEGLYFPDSNFEFTWDESVGDVSYADELMDFKYIGMNANMFGTLEPQLTPYQVLEGVRGHELAFQILRGNDTQIYTDYRDQNRASTGKNLRVKIYNSATNYLQLDYAGVILNKCLLNDGNQPNQEMEFYDVGASADSLIVSVVDGLAASFYGD